uniref:Putative conserved plasma membrane protein n=1 Tax=Culex tarsalis TaxID=7177 RepID=A0A1Q3FGH2_CULTA
MAPSTKETRIEKFQATECYQTVRNRLKQWYLRGQEVNLSDKNQLTALNKTFEVDTADQVVNLLGYALNKPLAEFKESPEEVDRLLATGEICFIEDKASVMIRKVVDKMKSYCFSLIPLFVIPDYDKPDKVYETLLIKVFVYGENCKISYVDMAARVYDRFEHYLERNKLPYSILCFPRNEQALFDAAGDLEVECRNVGLKNSVFNVTDIVLGVIGAVGSVGTIFATGGLAIPFLTAAMGSAAYTTGRSIEKLVDSDRHGMSLNPLKDADARNNWLMVSANLFAFASLGTSATIAAVTANAETMTATTLGRLVMTGRVLKGVTAGVNALTIVDSVVYTFNNWQRLSIYEKISLVCSVCFCFREVISFLNAERLIRECQVSGICNFFKECVPAGIQSIDMFVTNTRRLFESNDLFLETGIKLVREIIKKNISVTVDEEFTTIRFFGLEYKTATIFRMESVMLAKFLYMIQGIALNFKDAFSLMRRHFGDEAILTAVVKHADDIGGGEVAHYGQTVNELIQAFEILRRVANDITVLTEMGLIVGAGHRFTISSAFKVFVKCGLTKAIPLVKALVEMNPREAKRLNALRDRPDTQEEQIFQWITEGSRSSDEILSKARFLLSIDDLCTEQSLRITALKIPQASIEVESLVEADPKLFTRITPEKHRFFINPKFHRIFAPATDCHRDFLKQLWVSGTFLQPTPRDKFFEKLDALDVALQQYSSSVELVVDFAARMKSANFCQFAYHVLFALNNMERFMQESSLAESEANKALTADCASVVSRYEQCKKKAEEIALAGYCPADFGQPDEQLIEQVKQLAATGNLRFGPVENAVLHLDKNPMLRLESEILKYNRFLATKCFDQEDVKIVAAGLKALIYLSNVHLKVVIGVVHGEGAYIDTVQFTLEN